MQRWKCGWVGVHLEAFESETETTRVQFIFNRVSLWVLGSFVNLNNLLSLKLVLLIEN